MSELTEKLKEFGKENKGTDLGGLLQWAKLHIEDQDEAIKNLNYEVEILIKERTEVIKALEAAKTAQSAMNDALRCDFIANPFKTSAADFTSHVNIMMANEVEPYFKKKRIKKNEN